MGLFPSLIPTFPSYADEVDVVAAVIVNTINEEINSIAETLGTTVQGSKTNLTQRLAVMIATDGTLAHSSGFPAASSEGQAFWRNDLQTLYVFGNSQWNSQGQSVSNVLFQYSGAVDAGVGASNGEVEVTGYTPSAGATGYYRFLQHASGAGNYGTVWTNKFRKISGISSVVVYAQVWQQSGSAGSKTDLHVGIGSAFSTVSGTINQTIPEWVNTTIDVSGLAAGTVYNVAVQLNYSTGTAVNQYMGSLIGFGL